MNEDKQMKLAVLQHLMRNMMDKDFNAKCAKKHEMNHEKMAEEQSVKTGSLKDLPSDKEDDEDEHYEVD